MVVSRFVIPDRDSRGHAHSFRRKHLSVVLRNDASATAKGTQAIGTVVVTVNSMSVLYPHTPDGLPPLDPSRAALRDHVFQHALKTGDFTLKSGRKSSWFLDTKQTMCRPDGMLLVADAALEVIPARADAIGGLTMGADPVAFGVAAIAAERGVSLRSFSVRKETKDHGVTGRLAGALLPGDQVVITEDTVTRGTSIFEAVNVVREFGAHPILITVIVDRGGTCAQMAADADIEYIPLLTAPDLGFEFGS